LISTHQNDSKTLKNINFKQNKIQKLLKHGLDGIPKWSVSAPAIIGYLTLFVIADIFKVFFNLKYINIIFLFLKN